MHNWDVYRCATTRIYIFKKKRKKRGSIMVPLNVQNKKCRSVMSHFCHNRRSLFRHCIIGSSLRYAKIRRKKKKELSRKRKNKTKSIKRVSHIDFDRCAIHFTKQIKIYFDGIFFLPFLSDKCEYSNEICDTRLDNVGHIPSASALNLLSRKFHWTD